MTPMKRSSRGSISSARSRGSAQPPRQSRRERSAPPALLIRSLAFGNAGRPRVGLRAEPFVAFLAEAIHVALEQVLEHLDHADLAPRIAFCERMAAVGGGVFGPRVEAAVAPAREPRELRVLSLQEVDHRAHRG